MRTFSETWPSYRRHLLLHNDRVWLRETWPSSCSIWWCCVTTVWIYLFLKVCMRKNGNRHYSWNFGIFAIKMAYPNALLSFYCHLAFQLDPKPFSELSLFGFPLLRIERGFKCAAFFQVCAFLKVCCIFLSVPYIIFPSVPHFSKCAEFFQVCRIFSSVSNLSIYLRIT